MAKKVFTDESLATLVDEIKSYTDDSSATRATKEHGIYYGTCTTAADTAAKVVTLTSSTGFSLTTGAVVVVKFTNANSVSSPTLNVNSTGAKPIYRYDTTAASTSSSSTGWRAGAVQIFIYDGTGWVRDFWENTTYSNVALGQGYATCSTAAATVAKVGTLSSYSLSTGGIVAVKFTYAVPASATLNINSKGAKAIYYRGAAITADVIKAGDIATFIYNGSQYHLITIDRWQEDIKSINDALDGKANSSHNHSASNITSGVLAIERGGTGNYNGYIQIGALSGSTVGALATAEGRNTTASGSYSHAEGNYTEATGSSSHAEGQTTTASGTASHAEGENTTASGSCSHAEGEGTIASSKNQHVQGKYNKEDSSETYAHILGNGTGLSSSSRSNAHTIDWQGNAWFAGNVYIGGTSQSDAALLVSSTELSTAMNTLREEILGGEW